MEDYGSKDTSSQSSLGKTSRFSKYSNLSGVSSKTRLELAKLELRLEEVKTNEKLRLEEVKTNGKLRLEEVKTKERLKLEELKLEELKLKYKFESEERN